MSPDVDRLARALCAVQKRLHPPGSENCDGEDVGHDDFFGEQPCPECLDLARAVRDELEPAPRLQ